MTEPSAQPLSRMNHWGAKPFTVTWTNGLLLVISNGYGRAS